MRQHFESLGFYTDEATYHEVMSEEVRDRLASIYEPTSLYIRGRADRIAVHKHQPLVCQWEAKTHDTRGRHDMLIELLPFLHHLNASELGVKVIYAYQDRHIGIAGGFWVAEHPPVRQIFLTDRMPDSLLGPVNSMLATYMSRVPVRRNYRPTFGSGDPFFIVDEKDVRAMRHWAELVDEFAAGNSVTTKMAPVQNSLFF